MHIKLATIFSRQKGISIIELIAFMVVVGIASAALFKTYTYSVLHNVDPLIELRALELAQSRLDEVIALKYDENTPTGGIPACSSSSAYAVACNNTPDANMNDVDDFDNITDTPYIGYSRLVTVTTSSNVKLITVKVTAPQNFSVTLAAYRANF